MAVVITHPEMGIYLGTCMGLGFLLLFLVHATAKTARSVSLALLQDRATPF